MFLTTSPKILACIGSVVTIPVIAGSIGYAVTQKQSNTTNTPTQTTTTTDIKPIIEDNRPWLLVSSDALSSDKPTDQISFGENQNFTCVFNEKKDEACSITLFTPDATKKWNDLTNLNQGIASSTTPTPEELQTADNLFKVWASQELIDSIQWNTNTYKLELISKSEESKKYASLNPLFTANQTTSKSKKQLFLVKASEFFDSGGQTNAILTISKNKNYYCSFNEADVKDTSKHKACKFYKFTDAEPTENYTALVFVANKSDYTETMGADEWFLLEFNEPVSLEPEQNLTTIYVADSTDYTDASGNSAINYCKAATFTDNKPALFGPGHKNLFILN